MSESKKGKNINIRQVRVTQTMQACMYGAGRCLCVCLVWSRGGQLFRLVGHLISFGDLSKATHLSPVSLPPSLSCAEA